LIGVLLNYFYNEVRGREFCLRSWHLLTGRESHYPFMKPGASYQWDLFIASSIQFTN